MRMSLFSMQSNGWNGKNLRDRRFCARNKRTQSRSVFMNCLKCETEPLAAFTIEGVTVDRCSACAGVWFDVEELSQLLSEEAQHLAQLLKGSTIKQADEKWARCPRDASKMMRVYSAID